MGLFFTLFYVLTALLGPQTIFGDLVQYHVQIIIALVTLAFSLPSAGGSGLLRLPQTYAILGLSGAVFLSLAFNGWISGGPIALMDFLPSAMPFFFVVLNCRKKLHLQMLVVVLLFTAFFTTFRAWLAIHTHDFTSPYLLTTMTNDFGGQVIRIRGLAFISDPNDLAQFFVGLIPCVFLFWRAHRTFLNLLLVYFPIAGLVFGMYLTHSRGGMVALLAVAIVAGRRKLGVVPSVIAGIILFVGLSAAGFSGGREVSASSGEDRMAAWGVGLELVRSHPLFGVGFRRFTDFNDITAHNTIVVCAAELGLLGLFFWMFFIFPTVRDAVVGSKAPEPTSPDEAAEDPYPAHSSPHRPANPSLAATSFGQPAFATAAGQRITMKSTASLRQTPAAADQIRASGRRPSTINLAPRGYLDPDDVTNQISDAEIRRLAGVMMVSLAGFLTAGWFLSRAYVMTLYVNAGIAEVIYRMARERGIAPPILSFPRAMKLSLLTCIVLLLIVYGILRADHFFPK